MENEREAAGLDKEIAEIHKDFLTVYSECEERENVDVWLPVALKKHLPDYSDEKIQEISTEIVTSLKKTEDMKLSQNKAIAAGRSKEGWLSSKLVELASHQSTMGSVKYLQGIDDAIRGANKAMHDTIMTKSSGYTVPSQNQNLDGFIAEQHHVNSFNIEAATKGSGLRAEVQPFKPGQSYTKNGFDVVIRDAAGNRVHQYQMKYGATAEDTIRLLKSGNYNNQIIVVPEEQVKTVREAFPNKTVKSVIGDGDVTSIPLSKDDAKYLQEQAQNSNFIEADWSGLDSKVIAKGIGKQAVHVGLQGAVIGAGINIASKAIAGERVDGEEVVKVAVTSGADFGLKAATAGALKVASEKGILKVIPKGTQGSLFANIAFVAVENAKVFGKVATGELTVREGIDKMQQTTCSCVAGIAASAKGAAIGATIGGVLGPVGAFVGGLAGQVVGYTAGSKFGETIVKGAQKVRDFVFDSVKSVARTVSSGVSSLFSGVASLLGF